MRDPLALSKSLGFISILSLTACPDTAVVTGGSSVGDDEVGSETSRPDTSGETSGETWADTDGQGGPMSYFIGESTKFDGGGACNNDNLNTVTSTFRNALANDGWTGLRFVDENSWPEDFREGSFSGINLDGVYGDAARLSVYAGHGNVGLLQWGRPSDNGLCRNTLSLHSVYGSLAGDRAAATMFMTSCMMRVDQLPLVFAGQASRQFFGYHNSPHIGFDEARQVFKRCQDGQSTKDAWLEEMVLNGGGKNSPIVLTLGTSDEDAASMHGMTNLASGEGFVENVGEPADNFYFELYDSGCSSTCGNCTNATPQPLEVIIGTSTPRVQLSRPLRSADNLVELATVLLARFVTDPHDQAMQAALAAWAARVVASGDVGHALLLDQPRIDITYDPRGDLLRVTNRDALDAARPQPGVQIDDPADLSEQLELEAGAIRDALALVPGALDHLGADFQLTTRAGGFVADAAAPIAFEYLYELPGRFGELALPERRLVIGVTRLGELSTMMMSLVDVEVVGEARIERLASQALADLHDDLLDTHPGAVDVDFADVSVGYILREDQLADEVVPSLIVEYSLAYGEGEERVVSRRQVVRLSLTEPEALPEPLAALDPAPHGGDDRAH